MHNLNMLIILCISIKKEVGGYAEQITMKMKICFKCSGCSNWCLDIAAECHRATVFDVLQLRPKNLIFFFHPKLLQLWKGRMANS